jgi:hypothetical protein
MMLPSDQGKLGRWVYENVVQQCRTSVGPRIQLARSINTWRYTGSDSGSNAIYNRLDVHCDKLASALYSPAELRFSADFENDYGDAVLARGQVAARYLTREMERRNLDLELQEAVEEAVPHGAMIVKHNWNYHGPDLETLSPWQFGVYREDVTDLDKQEALCETTYLLPEDVWRRISHLSNARDLMRRIMQRARRTSPDEVPPGFLHQVLMAGTPPLIQDQGASASPGGMISLTGTPAMAMLAAEIAEGLIEAHQLWIVNDETGDYTTVQLIDPDILIYPRGIRGNLFMPYDQPYDLICVNKQSKYVWGRSEISGLIKLQALLRDRAEDIKKLMGLQYDRIRAFIGFSGMNDEKYDQMAQEGWIAEESPAAKVDDLTPPLPPNAFEEVKMIIQFFDDVAGFDNVLSGRGETGIRSANHFQGAVRQASPRLRDRAIRVERQVAKCGEKLMWQMATKDGRVHWTKSDDPGGKTNFTLSQLPDDTRILVDSHSSSPVFEQDHANTAAFLFKSGAIDAEDLLDLLPVPNRDYLKEKLKQRELSKRKLLESLPPELMARELAPGGKAHAHR